MIRQFPIETAINVDNLIYTDFLDLVKPRNKEFSDYVNTRLKDCRLGYDYFESGLGLSETTRLKFAKLF